MQWKVEGERGREDKGKLRWGDREEGDAVEGRRMRKEEEEEEKTAVKRAWNQVALKEGNGKV